MQEPSESRQKAKRIDVLFSFFSLRGRVLNKVRTASIRFDKPVPTKIY